MARPKNQKEEDKLPEGAAEVMQNSKDGLPEGTEPQLGSIDNGKAPTENQDLSTKAFEGAGPDFIQPDTYVENQQEEESGGKYTVLKGKSFRDRDDFNKEYKEGDNISHLSQDRLDHLVEIGYAKKG